MNKKNKSKLSLILLLLFFSVVGIISLFPLILMTVSSFKPAVELQRTGLNLDLRPELFSLTNYDYIFSGDHHYFRWFWNSLVVSGGIIILAMAFSSVVGYALGIYKFVGRNIVFIMVLITLMIPFEIMMLPLFNLMIDLRLIDTYFGVMLPMIVFPIAVFFFRQYALGLPKELLDSARIDGCTEFGIFLRIMAPLMIPAYAAMAILTGLFSWNNFLWPMLVLRSNEMFTLPVGLSTLLTPYGNEYELLIPGAVLSVVPILLLFLFFQRFFIAGLTVGGVKG